MSEHNNKVVVVDMFDRGKDGDKVSFETSRLSNIDIDHPKVHSVLLYYKDNKYLVIDPSNTSFSQILSGANENIIVCYNKDKQIYKAVGTTGTDYNLWRDCIDIAVKLAFNLSLNLKIGLDSELGASKLGEDKQLITIEELKQSNFIQEITNQTEIGRGFPSSIQVNNIRAKQSSDVRQSKKATATLRTIENIDKSLESELKSKGMTHLLLKFKQDQVVNNMINQISSAISHQNFFEKSKQAIETITNSDFAFLTIQDVELLKFECNQIDKLIIGVINE